MSAAPDPTSPGYEQAVAQRWGRSDPTIRSFWQSRVVQGEINRRVTGDPHLSPAAYFVRSYCQRPRGHALSLGCGDGGLEFELMSLGAAERMLAVDLSQARLDRAKAATPPALQGQIEFKCVNLERWRPEASFDLIVAQGVLHHIEGLERMFELVEEALDDDGLMYFDDFVGPSRFQWSDRQLAIINRLLDRLSPELRRDLISPQAEPRPPVTRPSIAAMISSDPSEAARSEELLEILHEHMEPLEERPWGGAVFHQLFNRLMGNFDGQDDLVRELMEFDAILTDLEVVSSDFVWGVYRFRPSARRRVRAALEPDGRLEEISTGEIIGWAADLAAPGRRLSVDVFVDHKLVRKALAHLPRDDLAREGIGDGGHGYSCELPPWVRDGAQHSISVVIPSVAHTLPVAALWAEHDRVVSDGTRFVWVRHDPSLPGLEARNVIVGADGWNFPCDDAVGSIEQMLGELCLTEEDLGLHRASLEHRARRLSELGIPYRVAIVPAKATIYPQRLPSSSPPLGGLRSGRQLLDELSGGDVMAIDLATPLCEQAETGEQLYHRRDQHWNHAGALIAAQALIQAMRAAGVQVDAIEPATIRWTQQRLDGDLAGRPGVAVHGGRLQPVASVASPEVTACPDEAALGLVRTQDPAGSVVDCPGRGQAPRAVVFHDTSGEWLIPFLGAAFSHSVWLARGPIDAPLIERERPDVVLEVIEEWGLVRGSYAGRPNPARSR
jgi:SAM-dependent methyltransferase